MLEAGQKVGAAQVPGDARVLYSCGTPMKGVDLRIVHPESAQPCEEGHVGEIWLSSLCVTAGYYNRPKLNQDVFQVCAACRSPTFDSVRAPLVCVRAGCHVWPVRIRRSSRACVFCTT